MSDDICPKVGTEHFFTAFNGRYGAMEEGTYLKHQTEAVDGPDLGALKMMTFCVLVLKDGTPIAGESICSNPSEFNAEHECKSARENAVRKMMSRESATTTGAKNE